jgi:hypothetical protein
LPLKILLIECFQHHWKCHPSVEVHEDEWKELISCSLVFGGSGKIVLEIKSLS